MGERKLVLIVEDDSRMAGTLASMIQLLGYDTSLAHTSRGAVAAARRLHPALILLDLNLPDVNGFEVVRFIKREPDLAQTPIIFVSAESSPEVIATARTLGAANFLVKPVGIDDLETAIAQVF